MDFEALHRRAMAAIARTRDFEAVHRRALATMERIVGSAPAVAVVAETLTADDGATILMADDGTTILLAV